MADNTVDKVHMIIFNRTKNMQVVSNALKADTFMTRLLGLIPRKTLGREEGLWLDPCAMIHTCFMSFPIDAVFLTSDLRVAKVCPALKPWRCSPWVRGAQSVLELASGAAAGLFEAGDVLEFRKEIEKAP
jgi:hypothetical protein